MYRIHIVVIGEPPGLPTVARRLGLEGAYTIPDDMEAQYFWYEPTVLVADAPESHSFRANCLYYLCMALCDHYFGATWGYTWAIHGYASLLTFRLMYPAHSVHSDMMAHLWRARDTGKCLRLRTLFEVDYPPEGHGGETAYNELAHYLIQYLYSQMQEVPQAWQVVRAHIAREVTSVSEVVRRLEAAFGLPIDAIEAGFYDWCARMHLSTDGGT